MNKYRAWPILTLTYLQVILPLERLLTQVTHIFPLVTVCQPVLGQGTGIAEWLATCWTGHQSRAPRRSLYGPSPRGQLGGFRFLLLLWAIRCPGLICKRIIYFHWLFITQWPLLFLHVLRHFWFSDLTLDGCKLYTHITVNCIIIVMIVVHVHCNSYIHVLYACCSTW